MTSTSYEKHPLRNEWTMWITEVYDRSKNHTETDWAGKNKKISTFDTVEDFWSVLNHIILPSGFEGNTDLCLFKEGILPMWEDPQNLGGSRLLVETIKPKKKIQERKKRLDKIWIEVCMAVLGGQFHDHDDSINGIVFNSRETHTKISLWIKRFVSVEAKAEISKKFHSTIQNVYPQLKEPIYQDHPKCPESYVPSGVS